MRMMPSSSSSTQRADRVGVRHRRVGPVELVEADRVDAEALGRGLGGLLQVLGTAVLRPRVRLGPQVAALGRDEHAGGVAAVALQGLGDEQLVVADLVSRGQVVGVGRVDEGDAGVEGGVDRGDRPLARRGGPRSTWACRPVRWR